MYAEVGDRILIPSLLKEGASREAQILEIHDRAGRPPYVVRWADTGYVSRIVPGPLVVILAGEQPR
jgi:hypothetical protein